MVDNAVQVRAVRKKILVYIQRVKMISDYWLPGIRVESSSQCVQGRDDISPSPLWGSCADLLITSTYVEMLIQPQLYQS